MFQPAGAIAIIIVAVVVLFVGFKYVRGKSAVRAVAIVLALSLVSGVLSAYMYERFTQNAAVIMREVKPGMSEGDVTAYLKLNQRRLGILDWDRPDRDDMFVFFVGAHSPLGLFYQKNHIVILMKNDVVLRVGWGFS
ncbi:MAG: hypothetical protein AMXMBFR84_50390 [Candidatus Hydrogenedentota bacterium]